MGYIVQAGGIPVSCQEEGHCWHEGTAWFSLCCCKCGTHWTPHLASYDNTASSDFMFWPDKVSGSE